jgi:predicted transcriptional regulator
LWKDAPHTGEYIAALREALREDALELLAETHRQLEHFSERGTVGTALAIAAAVQAERQACAAIAKETSFLVGHRILERGRQ